MGRSLPPRNEDADAPRTKRGRGPAGGAWGDLLLVVLLLAALGGLHALTRAGRGAAPTAAPGGARPAAPAVRHRPPPVPRDEAAGTPAAPTPQGAPAERQPGEAPAPASPSSSPAPVPDGPWLEALVQLATPAGAEVGGGAPVDLLLLGDGNAPLASHRLAVGEPRRVALPEGATRFALAAADPRHIAPAFWGRLEDLPPARPDDVASTATLAVPFARLRHQEALGSSLGLPTGAATLPRFAGVTPVAAPPSPSAQAPGAAPTEPPAGRRLALTLEAIPRGRLDLAVVDDAGRLLAPTERERLAVELGAPDPLALGAWAVARAYREQMTVSEVASWPRVVGDALRVDALPPASWPVRVVGDDGRASEVAMAAIRPGEVTKVALRLSPSRPLVVEVVEAGAAGTAARAVEGIAVRVVARQVQERLGGGGPFGARAAGVPVLATPRHVLGVLPADGRVRPGADGARHATTDVEGIAVFHGLAAGGYWVSAEGDGWIGSESEWTRQLPAPGDADRLALAVARPPVVVEVELAGPAGSPPPDGEVVGWVLSSAQERPDRSDGGWEPMARGAFVRGRARLELPRLGWWTFMPNLSTPGWVVAEGVAPASLHVGDAGPTSMRFEVQASGTVRLRVVNLLGGPVANLPIWAEEVSDVARPRDRHAGPPHLTTDAEGRVELSPPVGRYRLRLLPSDWLWPGQSGGEVEVGAGEVGDHEIPIAWPPLEVQVLDESDDRPVRGAVVEVSFDPRRLAEAGLTGWNSEGAARRTAVAGGDGVAALGALPPGAYVVVARDSARATRSVAFEHPGAGDRLTIRLPPRGGSVRWRLRDAAGEPVVFAELVAAWDEAGVPLGLGGRVFTVADGTAMIPVLPSGRYRFFWREAQRAELLAQSEQFPAILNGLSDWVEVGEGEVTEVALEMSVGAWLRVGVEVAEGWDDVAEEALGRWQVAIEGPWDDDIPEAPRVLYRGAQEAKIGGPPRARLGWLGLPPGRHRVTCKGRGWQFDPPVSEVDLRAGETIELKVTARPAP